MSELLRRTGDPDGRQLPRMALRYRLHTTKIAVHVPGRRWLRRRSKTIQCELIDLSIDGALIAFPAGTAVDNGVRLDVDLQGNAATVGVRHGELGPDNRLRCGVAFRATTPSFDDVVSQTIAGAIDDPRRHQAWRIS